MDNGQGTNLNALVDNPMKRRRGRPRKYPRLNIVDSAPAANMRDINRGESSSLLPAIDRMNGNRPLHVRQSDGADLVVGEVVSGVVEAVFDAGYLLGVRVGNTGTTLRGVVLKPGHFVPVTAENDVAPDVPMVRRNEVPFPSENHSQGRRPRNSTFPSNGSSEANQFPGTSSRSSDQIVSVGKSMPPAVAQTADPMMSRGNVVPVVLQPSASQSEMPDTKSMNGIPSANEASAVANQAAHLSTLKGKEVLAPAFQPDGSASTPSAAGKEALSSQPPMTTQKMDLFQSESEPSKESVPAAEEKPLLEKLVNEVMKRLEAPAPLEGAGTENSNQADKMSGNGSGHWSPDTAKNMGASLRIEPLRAVQPSQETSFSVSKPEENDGTNETAELFQEDITQGQVPHS